MKPILISDTLERLVDDEHHLRRTKLCDLVRKTADVLLTNGRWTVYYLGFARTGWTEAALHLPET